jgi:hypothetical protein
MSDKPDDPELEEYEGFIALFDILGYQNFLSAHNSPAQATRDVLRVLLNSKNEVPKHAKKLVDPTVPYKEIERFHWRVFSDTILIALPSEPNQATAGSETATMKNQVFDLIHISIIAGYLQRYMFDLGLPVRGAITQGTFLLADTCFAGIPIVDAHILASQLDFAGCVIHRDIRNKFKDETIGTSFCILENGFVRSYLAPLTTGKEEMLPVVFPSISAFNPDTSWHDEDIKQLVANAFWKHGKTISTSVLSKIANTEMLLRFMKMKMGQHFK